MIIMSTKFDVTVIVACYNASLRKTLQTIESIIKQKYVKIQLIIADDGSKNNNFQSINSYLNRISFHNYILLDNKDNLGTCKNLYRAIRCAEGNYVKFISPGDFLYSETTLHDWVGFLKSHNIEVSFGKAVYYMPDQKHTIIEAKAQPSRPDLFSSSTSKKHFIYNYIVMRDNILGACVFGKTDIVSKYLHDIKDEVKLAEDNAYRLMAICDVRPIYYNQIVLWYEYGTGVSTQPNSKGYKQIDIDFQNTDKIILQKINTKQGFFYWKLKKYVYLMTQGESKNILRRNFLFPNRIFFKIINKFASDITPIHVQTAFLDKFYYKDF